MTPTGLKILIENLFNNLKNLWKRASEFYGQHVVFLIVGSIFCLVIFTNVNSYLLSTVAEKRVLRESQAFSDAVRLKSKMQPIEPSINEAVSQKMAPSPALPQNGIHRSYDAQSKVFTETNYKDGKREGLSKSFLKDGTVIEEMRWTDDKPDGVHTLYYRNGKPMQEATFKNGRRDGLVKTFYEDGNIMIEEHYLDGERQYLKRYDPRGKQVLFEDYTKKDEPLPETKQGQ